MMESEIEHVKKVLVEEQKNHQVTYLAWKTHYDDVVAQIGTPQEEETLEVEEPVTTLKNSSIGPEEDVVTMQTD
ncbi:hypothetical protein FRX31_033387 [Thalictrum thalictroides]|uniref:Uncharacterized protein n=1 Tax=Thalictrum thalictroides TaxID=46969 RepID=A0A7J6UWP9_THATH|nr:hypothetical protein FRX31_033387 [Thalictrum thalictroides]